MVDEIKEVLEREGITSAAIIDDVFDDTPTSTDIDDESWNFFLDDVADREIEIIRGYGVTDPASRWAELRRDDKFIQFLWDHRAETAVHQGLFRLFEQKQTGGKAQLQPLRTVLFDELQLQGGVYGSRGSEAAERDAQLLFVDLFLGGQQDETAREKALARVTAIVEPRRQSPPIIVLMSSSTRLHGMRDDFRDEAGLMGCQFRTVQKTDLSDTLDIHELLLELTSSYRDSLRLSEFLELWRLSLQEATSRFVRAVRRLDLRDYADLQALILAAEGELIGTYFLEVFGQYFQFELEEDARLSAAALNLNKLKWESYPAPNFLPSEISANIADGLLFRSSKILSKPEPLQFGDVLFSSRVDALGEGTQPAANFAKGERLALVLLTAACDIQHGNAKRFLFIAGVAKPSELLFHKKPSALLTPVLFHDDKHYVLEWDLGAPVAWTPKEAIQHLEAGDFERVRRFRPLFSLQLQQLFTSGLSRVGTLVMPPIQQLMGVRISYVDQNSDLRQLVAYKVVDRKAVALVGRDEEKFVDRLMLAPEVVGELRVAMQKVDVDSIAEKKRENWKSAVESRTLFAKMKEGIPYDRKGFARAFKGLSYDIVTVIGPYSDTEKGPITAERKLKGDQGPLIVELDIPPNS